MIDDTLCSFCGRGKPEVKVIIKSGIKPYKFICDECVAGATQLINEDKKNDGDLSA